MRQMNSKEAEAVHGGNPAFAIGIGLGAVTGAINGAMNGGGWSGALRGGALGAAVAVTGTLAVVTRGFTAIGWGIRSVGLGVIGGSTGSSSRISKTNDETNESDE